MPCPETHCERVRGWLRPAVAVGLIALGAQSAGADAPNPGSRIILVDSPEALDAIRDNLGGCYELAADIDLTGYALSPIGSEADPFTGVLDGGGFTISNFAYDGMVHAPAPVGLFGVASGATIINLSLTDVWVRGWLRVGGVAGLVNDGGTISNTQVTGLVEGLEDVGGLAGRAHGATIEWCWADVDACGLQRWVGGLVGHCHPGTTVTDSSAYGAISGGVVVGGLVGNHHGSRIERCHATGPVMGPNWTGGLVGYCQEDLLTDEHLPTAVISSSATGDVLGGVTGVCAPASVVAGGVGFPGSGGLIGYLEPNSVVLDSFATGSVQSPDDSILPTGGLIGFTEAGVVIRNSFALGDVTGGHPVGGLVGWSDSDIVDCHADGDVSGTWSVGGLVAHAGSSAPIVISGCHARGAVAASGDVNGHADPGHLLAAAGGLVGYLFPGTMIEDSFATGAVNAEAEQAGGLVGFFWAGKIVGCYATGDVTGLDHKIGGLVGNVRLHNWVGDCEIIDCYALGAVHSRGEGPEAQGHAGGLVGRVEARPGFTVRVRNCFAVGRVGLDHPTAGGLVGSMGPGAAISGCYWDTDTSGQGESAAGEGCTTEQLMQQAHYQGWDFDAVWTIEEGRSYPFLRWQQEGQGDKGTKGQTRAHGPVSPPSRPPRP